MSTTPLSSSPLSRDEAARILEYMMPLLRYLGAPGDWGYQSRLGVLTQQLRELRADIINAVAAAPEEG